jgi:hypothetical protein
MNHEDRTLLMHSWAEQLREMLRLRLEPGSDNLRAEYKLANDLVYAFRGRPKEIHLEFTEQELAAVQELSEYHQLSQLQTMRQALRSYQLQERRIRNGETVTWSGDAERMREFAGIPTAGQAAPE